MERLKEDIKNRQFKQIYLLTGEEVYLRNQYKKKLKEALVKPDDTMNYAYYEGKGISAAEIIDLAQTMPFFADYRVILIENSGFTKNASPELAEYVKDIPESTCIILVEAEVDKRGKLYKAIRSKGRVVEFKRPKDSELARWVQGTLKKEGKRLTGDTFRLFLECSGSNMENMDRELEKLLCYTLGKDVITSEDVEAVCTVRTENRVFQMVQAIIEKNQQKALKLYADLLALKEEPLYILACIAGQFNRLMLLKNLIGQGLDNSEMASAAGIQPFALGKSLALCRKFSVSQLRQAVEDCVEAEERVKTGRMDSRISVELLIIKYSR